ncbi:118_t:CDS:2, partial [Funneliformis geosporum]
IGVKEVHYRRIQSAAARIWQQMLKISDIAVYLKEYNHSKKQSAEILLAQIEYEIEEYNEKQMEEIIMTRSLDDDEQIPFQELEISKILDLELMFENKPVGNKQIEIDELDKFIQELNKEEDFDPDSL